MNKQGTPVYLASGIFRPGQIFFKWYGGWYRKFLSCFAHIFVQQKESQQLLEKFGISRVSVAGDTRFDRVKKLAATDYSHVALEAFSGESTVIIAGSTWERDEQLLEYAYQKLPPNTRWIIAPHELSEAHIMKLQKRFPNHILFTEMDRELRSDIRVVIVNTIGQLSYLYRYGTLAYIGGGFGKGIHNTLEAAAYDLPVIFGPNYHKFSEAVELTALSAAFPVYDEKELLLTIHQQLENPKLLKTSSKIAGNFVLERVGATSVILEKVCKNSDANML